MKESWGGMNHSESTIQIIGCGPGSPGYLTMNAIRAVESVSVLFGAKRLLALFQDFPGKKIEVIGELQAVYSLLENYIETHVAVGVLVTGDPSIASLAQPILKRFGAGRCRIVPGISSVQVACARLGLDLCDTLLINAHKDMPDKDPETLQKNKNILVLIGNKKSDDWVIRTAVVLRETHVLYACSDLSLETESITEIKGSISDMGDLPTKSSLMILAWVNNKSVCVHKEVN
jgi:precorrin-6y C5,15-methyltransferase (decarboxylating) CbiE subunit